MSRIDELIKQNCPTGVGFVSVASILNKVRITESISKDLYQSEGAYPVVNQAQNLVAAYSDDESKVLPTSEYIVFGDHTRCIKWVDFAFIPGESGTLVFKVNQGVDPKYAYYALANLEIESRGYNRHWTVARDLPIPLPPIEVQQEIVYVLDKFTQLEAELEAELEARRKQYEHYHQTLIWGHASNKGSRWCTVKDICIDKFWLMPATPKYIDDGEIPYITSKNLQDGEISFEKAKLISHESFMEISKNRSIQCGDILIGMIGTIGEVAIVKPNDPRFYGQNMYLLRLNLEEIDVDYFLQFLNSREVRNRFLAVKHNSSQGYLKAEHVENLRLPLPSLLEQRRIASMLDSFKAMTKSVCVGLPAEIDARRKQYEYYRDRLLTFKELGAA